MRRLIPALAAAGLVAGVLAGCGTPPAPAAIPPVDGTSTETPAPVAPASVFASRWSGFWTWKGDHWFWTWVWYDDAVDYQTG